MQRTTPLQISRQSCVSWYPPFRKPRISRRERRHIKCTETPPTQAPADKLSQARVAVQDSWTPQISGLRRMPPLCRQAEGPAAGSTARVDCNFAGCGQDAGVYTAVSLKTWRSAHTAAWPPQALPPTLGVSYEDDASFNYRSAAFRAGTGIRVGERFGSHATDGLEQLEQVWLRREREAD